MTQSSDPETGGKTSPQQNATNLWAELGPAGAFILTYTFMGKFLPEGEGAFSRDAAIFWATGALMVMTAAVIIIRLSQGKNIPPMLFLTGGVVGFFGVLTIALQQRAFAYVKPTIINTLFAVLIFGGLMIRINVWKKMLAHAFHLPDFAWDVLAFRWGCYFIFLAVLNEFLWRFFCPVPESPLVLLGLTIAPSEPYTLFGISFGVRDQEFIWAWSKFGTIPIFILFMLANLPYTMKHWDHEKADAAAGE